MTAPMTERKPLEIFAIVEIMGHQRVAGRVTEEPIAGTVMLRVDVPAVGDWPAYTTYCGGGSIYRIHPCTEDIARQAAEQLARQYGYTPLPVAVPDLTRASQVIREANEKQLGAGSYDDRDAYDPGF